jgi:type IV secretory pathway VirB2 component (pilin)
MTLTKQRNYHWALWTAVLLAAAMPELAQAQGNINTIIGGGLCNVYGALTGTVAQGIATLAVLFLGIGAFFGKVTWALAITVAVGIATIFGAAAIVSTIGDVAPGTEQGCP